MPTRQQAPRPFTSQGPCRQVGARRRQHARAGHIHEQLLYGWALEPLADSGATHIAVVPGGLVRVPEDWLVEESGVQERAEEAIVAIASARAVGFVLSLPVAVRSTSS